MNKKLNKWILFGSLTMALQSQAVELKVTIENLNSDGGLYTTPVWVGFHNGEFDIYDTGTPASEAVERFAEDGDFSVLRSDFGDFGVDDVIINEAGFPGAPIFDPGQKSSVTYDLNPSSHRYFSYSTMILPSNDAFVANANEKAHQIFDEFGDFSGPVSFIIYGSQVRDAGTEENNETDAAFFDQAAPNSGNTTEENIQVHTGFNGSLGNPNETPVNFLGGNLPPGTILDAVNGDFTQPGKALMRITIQSAYEPLRVSVKNQSQLGGTFLTPVWLGFHNGTFDMFDVGSTSSIAIERAAEDGSFADLNQDFDNANVGQDLVLLNPEGFAGAPLFDPQMSSYTVIQANPLEERYLSFLSMVLPSNDAFIGNDNPRAYRIFDENGYFQGPLNIKVNGQGVWDAGTEANTETNAAFFDQSAPDTGDSTTEVIVRHSGFNGSFLNPDGAPQNFLGGTNGPGISFDESAADFTIAGNEVAEIRVSRLIDGGFSGSWYNPEKSGHGFVIDVTSNPDGTGSRAMVSWYNYNADGSGNQMWLVGVGPIVGDTAFVDMAVTEGASFGTNFDAADVNRTLWGQVNIKFTSCTTAVMSYDSGLEGFGSGEENLTRLTSGPVDYNGACQL